MRSLLIGLVALLVLATGATAASSKQSKNPLRPGNVHRLCVWVEQGGTPDTAWDLKAVKAYTATHKVCIEGKKGKPGKNGKNGRAGAKGATGAQGAQGLMGTAGAQGLQGIAGLNGVDGIDGFDGIDGLDGKDGTNGTNGHDGVSVTSAVEPPGDNCAAGGSSFTAANDNITYACNGIDGENGDVGPAGPIGPAGPTGPTGPTGPIGPQGPQGIQGPAGPAGFSGLVTVAGGDKSGEKQFTVDCPENEATADPDDLLEAVSGGFNIQGSVTADYRSDSAGNPLGKTSWTVIQSSGADLSGKVFVYCLAPAAP